jgi:hypothetical protein
LVDFVEEVEERLRAERYRALANRYLPWIVAALVAAIVGWLGVWGYDAWRDRNIGQASIAYDKGMTALAGGDTTGAYNTVAPIAKNGPAGYRTLALMLQANIRLGAGKADEAATLYDAAAKAAPSPILGDLARLRAAQTLMDTAPYAQLETRLKPLAGDNRPYSLQAREMLAMAKLQAGKTQEARGDFNALSLTLGVTPSMRARAQGAIALIDSGQAALVGQVVKTAATLPPLAAAMSLGPAHPPPSGAPVEQDSDQTPPQNAAPPNASGNPQ